MPLLDPTLSHFAPISLKEMDAVSLQSRMDTKYLVPATTLPRILEELAREYRMLVVDGHQGSMYRTQYLDTPELRAYHDHHNGRPRRSKVRMREYASSGLCFLEVKRRTGRGRTVKRRIPVPGLATTLDREQMEFVASVTDLGPVLVPTVWNEFRRFTLVHPERIERITIDIGLNFRGGGRTASLPGVCVAELKEGRAGHGSPFAALMRALPSPPTRFSKYCVGTILLEPGVKYNQFKPILLRARKLGLAA